MRLRSILVVSDLSAHESMALQRAAQLAGTHGADLVVVGRTITTAWQDFFRGSVSHHVLAWGSTDVLVVPQPRALAASQLRAAGTLRRNERPALGLGGTEGGWT